MYVDQFNLICSTIGNFTFGKIRCTIDIAALHGKHIFFILLLFYITTFCNRISSTFYDYHIFALSGYFNKVKNLA